MPRPVKYLNLLPTTSYVVNATVRCVRVSSTNQERAKGGGKGRNNGLRETVSTGVIVVSGLVICCWHSVEEPELDRYTVNDRVANLIHYSHAYDLAALSVTTQNLGMVRYYRGLPNKGVNVFYVGNPNECTKSVVPGVVTHRSKTAIATNCIPGGGCSGSGLYSATTGELMGIVDSGTESMSYAVPSGIIKQFVDESLAARRGRPLPPYRKPLDGRAGQLKLDFRTDTQVPVTGVEQG